MHTTPKQILYSCQNSNITTLSYINPVLSRITGSQSCSPAQRSRPAPSRPTPARRAGTGWPKPTRSPTRGPGRRTPPPNSSVETEWAATATSHSAPADILIASHIHDQPSMSGHQPSMSGSISAPDVCLATSQFSDLGHWAQAAPTLVLGRHRRQTICRWRTHYTIISTPE